MRRAGCQIPIVFYIYFNLIHRHGIKAFARDAAVAGVDGVLALDLPPEEVDRRPDSIGKAIPNAEILVLRDDGTPYYEMRRAFPQLEDQEIRDHLAKFLFRGVELDSPISGLSGGERARLVLATIVWQRPNLLLLDEPTNHLDLNTREALSMALNEFEGSVMLVSHDRALLREVCDEFWLVTAAFSCLNSPNQLVLTHHVAHFVEAGQTKILVAGIVGLVGLVSIPGKILWGYLADRWWPEWIYLAGCAFVVAGIAVLLGIGPISPLWHLYLYAALMGVGYAVSPAMTPIMCGLFFGGPHFGVIFGALILWSIGGALEQTWGPRKLLIFSLGVTTLAALLTALRPDVHAKGTFFCGRAAMALMKKG